MSLDVLRSCVEHLVRNRWGSGAAITAMHRRPASNVGSYACEVVSIRLATGDEFDVFLKDFGISRLPKDGRAQRRERERWVYRELLAGADLGTPSYYGCVWDESRSCFWLLLEFVDAVPFDSHDRDAWTAAAAWLGRMQGYFAHKSHLLRASSLLLRHNADFFWSKAELARRAVAQISPMLVGRFDEVLSCYDSLVQVMVSHSPTLVHGSYRPENIMVAGRYPGLRLCPIDWELAGLGAPLYDLAFISDGADAATRDRLYQAYREAALAADLSVPTSHEMASVIMCFRLHKIIKSVGDSPTWSSPETRLPKLICHAERVSQAAHGRTAEAL